MNVIDSYFAGAHILNYRARSDLCSNFEKPLKRVKLKDILNINPNETEFLRSFIKSKPNVHSKENKKNEKHSNAESENSNLNCVQSMLDGKANLKKSLQNKDSSDLTINSYLRRSSRIKNKLDNKVIGSSDIHQSFVIVSPLKQYSHSIQNTKNNVQTNLTQFKNISNFKVTNNDNNNNNNQLNIKIKNNKVINILEKGKYETRSTVSKESDIIFMNSSRTVKRGRPKINEDPNLISSLSKEHHPEPLINNIANKRKKNLKTIGSAKKGRQEVNKVKSIFKKGKDETLSVSKELISDSNKDYSEPLINNAADKRKKNLKSGCAEKGRHDINKDLDLTNTDKIDFTKSQVKLRGRRRKHCDTIDSKEQNVSNDIESTSKNLKTDFIRSVFEPFRDLDLTHSDKIDSSKSHVRRKNCDAIDSKEQNVSNNTKSTSKNAKQNKKAANEIFGKFSKKKGSHESNENKGSKKTEREESKDKSPSSLVQKNENVFDKKKKARAGTLRYLKERQNALRKLLVEENPVDYVEVCKGKKSKALEDLLKIDENETLAIKTPNEKHKIKESFMFTPRTALLDEWAKISSCPSSSTPKNDFKSKGRCEQQGALNVLYHHLKNNPSKRRKKTDWCKDADNKAKIPKKIQKSKSQKANRQDVDNFMDLNLSKNEKEIFNCLSQKPSQDLNESSFDDYFNMSS